MLQLHLTKVFAVNQAFFLYHHSDPFDESVFLPVSACVSIHPLIQPLLVHENQFHILILWLDCGWKHSSALSRQSSLPPDFSHRVLKQQWTKWIDNLICVRLTSFKNFLPSWPLKSQVMALFNMLASSTFWFQSWILYDSKCVHECPPGRALWVPCKTFITCNWGSVFPTATLLKVFSAGLLQEWSKSICLTFVHNIWPLGYSTLQLINNATSTHVFPFTMLSKGTHHPACHYPAPSTTMSPFSLLFTRFQSGKEWAFDHEHDEMWSNLIYCWGNYSQRHPSSPTPKLNQLDRSVDNTDQSRTDYIKWSVCKTCSPTVMTWIKSYWKFTKGKMHSSSWAGYTVAAVQQSPTQAKPPINHTYSPPTFF